MLICNYHGTIKNRNDTVGKNPLPKDGITLLIKIQTGINNDFTEV